MLLREVHGGTTTIETTVPNFHVVPLITSGECNSVEQHTPYFIEDITTRLLLFRKKETYPYKHVSDATSLVHSQK